MCCRQQCRTDSTSRKEFPVCLTPHHPDLFRSTQQTTEYIVTSFQGLNPGYIFLSKKAKEKKSKSTKNYILSCCRVDQCLFSPPGITRMGLLFDYATIQIYILHTSGYIQVIMVHLLQALTDLKRGRWLMCVLFVPRVALRFIRPDPRARVTDPVGDVVSFIQSFEEKYGRSHPVFYQGTYSQVRRS